MNITYSIKEWESNFFKRAIYSAELQDSHSLHSDSVDGLVTCNIDSHDYDKLDALCKFGYSYIEGDIDFCKKINFIESDNFNQELIATSNDIVELSAIVKGLYRFSRFREPWFREKERDLFYLMWLENAVNGSFDDICIISKDNVGAIAGFATVKITESSARIGLLGVRKNSERSGVASYLLSQAEEFAMLKNADQICVSTQISNISAIRLYTKNSFIPSSTSIWLYKNEIHTI
ncbi:GNAT family N-acetyltransferase [Aeromonas sp. QDB14]|uniref:GNAT family N-acetyltransferase n=1 Tax=Aeromonas sp. QDB14 TaxID=2989836 RepID=UPI0022E7D55D|nr:GNAT family N-acetyltransferase [Aeromonas sp. QDB14]